MNPYETAQMVTYRSHESTIAQWREGQRRFLDRWFKDLRRNTRIADVGCGDGCGLEWFRENGFWYVSGIEFNPAKACIARQVGYPVLEQDMHELAISKRDVIFCSHTLEHAHDPETVLYCFRNVLVPDGKLFLILPFPDQGPVEAHCGKTILHTEGPGVQPFVDFVETCGFGLEWIARDSFREPEIWACFKRLL